MPTLVFHITSIGAIIVAAIASYTDIKTAKIYNKLTFPGAGLGIIVRAVEYGMNNPNTMVATGFGGAINAILGWLFGVFLVVVLKTLLRLKEIGHGDSKLMGCLGAWVGPGLILGTFLYYCVFFSVYTIATMAIAFPWKQWLVVRDLTMVDLTKFNEVRRKPLPMAPFITAGLVVALVFEKQTLQFFGFIK